MDDFTNLGPLQHLVGTWEGDQGVVARNRTCGN